MKLNDTNSTRACLKELEKIRQNISEFDLFSFESANRHFQKCIISGGDSIEDPPVPIPNTEVKLNSVDGT